MTTPTARLIVGQRVTYYPRAGKSGHDVEIVAITPHAFHRELIRFRYADGRERELTIGRFHRSPE